MNARYHMIIIKDEIKTPDILNPDMYRISREGW